MWFVRQPQQFGDSSQRHPGQRDCGNPCSPCPATVGVKPELLMFGETVFLAALVLALLRWTT
jgi:hypothetical protein